jgi:uncharacterized repeat protein (TIGR03803 family)
VKSSQPSRAQNFSRFVNFALTVAAVTFALATAARSQTEKVLYSFAPNTGQHPVSGVIVGADGVFGTTSGTNGPSGTVFELSPVSYEHWEHVMLFDFPQAQDGWTPSTGLISDAAGNLYGTTLVGGNLNDCNRQGCGAVFELSPGSGHGWNETILYAFTGGVDGGSPEGSLIFDSAGNLYGTTYWNGDLSVCGTSGCGVVFKLSPSSGGWKETVLHTFTGGADGSHPATALVFDTAGNLYGTTYYGGKVNDCGGIGCGVAFKLSPASNGGWKETVLHTFTGGLDGANPWASLVLDSAGNLYGTAYQGGKISQCTGRGTPGCGTIFQLSHGAQGWKTTVLHTFDGAQDGSNPAAGLVFDSAGNLYGTTQQGGNTGACALSGCGTVFELSHVSGSVWHETVLHAFHAHPDGSNPLGGVAFDPAGNLYGTTYLGGANGGGTVFEITP